MQTVKKFSLIPEGEEHSLSHNSNESVFKLALALARVDAYNDDLQIVSGKHKFPLIPLLKFASGQGGSSIGKDILLKHLIAANVNHRFIANQHLQEEYVKIKDKGTMPMDISNRHLRWTKIN